MLNQRKNDKTKRSEYGVLVEKKLFIDDSPTTKP